MVKKNKQLQVAMIYQRFQDEYEENYIVERDSLSKGIDYAMIVEFRNEFVEQYQIRTEVRMSYLSSDEEIHELTDTFLLTYAQLERDYDGSLVILLRAEIDCVTSRIENLEKKLDHLIHEIEELKKLRTVVADPPEDLRKHQSLPDKLVKTASSYDPSANNTIDVGVLFSEPLVQRINDKEVSNTAEPVKFREEIERLYKSLRKTACGEITLKCLIASVEKLEFMLKYKVKILHIICHGLVEVDKAKQTEEGVLCFEMFHEIGTMDKIYGREIPDLLKNVRQEDRPKLVFVNACHSQLIGDAFLNSGVEYVVVIQSSQTIEDIAAQLFAERFYNNLFNGMGVQKSFTNAKDSLDRQNRPVNSNICCCHHRLDVHDSDCLWKKLLLQMQKDTAHDLYHVPTCKCSKRHLSIHELSCTWAIETLFNINKEFRVKEQGKPDRQPTVEEVSRDYPFLQICCCTTKTRSIPHDESEKFKFKHLPNVDPNKSLVTTTLQEMNSEVYNTTPNELQRDFHAYQKLFGRNEDIYDLIKEILKPPKVLILRGAVGSGRTGVVAKAVTYLIERGKYKDEYIHLNLSNCSKHIDFEFCFLRKVRSMKVSDYNEALTRLCLKDMMLVLDNADEYAQTAPKEFDNEVSYLIDRLSFAKFIIVLNDKTQLQLKTTTNLSSKVLGPLKVFAATDMFMINAKEYIDIKNIEVDHREIRRLFASQRLRNPKTILDMVHLIKNQYSPTNKMPLSVLAQYVQNILENRTSTDKFLEENLNNLRRNPDVYQLLLFIAQFEGGLTELDFSIMSNQREVRDELTMVKMQSAPAPVLRRGESEIFLSANWRNLVNELLAENYQSKGSTLREGFMKEGEYYYCIVEQKAEGFKSIRVKKYILDYLRKFDKSVETDLKFKALAYLSTFSSILVRLFREKHYYHEQLAEYSTVSNCGVFQYERSVKFANVFDEGEYFPDAVHDLTRSTSRGREIDNEINDIFEGNPIVLERHPAQSVLQHQENFLQMYGSDFSDYYQQLPSEKRKLFRHYYHSILLNIPTLVKLAIEKSNSHFLKYCIDESIKKVNQLQPGKVGRSENLCTIKLLFMQVVHEIGTRGKTEQLVSSYKNYFESIRLKLVWDKNSEVNEMELLDYYFLKVYIKYENLRQTGRMELDDYNKIVQLNANAKRIADSEPLRSSPGAKLLLAKFSLLLTEILLRLLDKDEFKNKFDLGKRSTDIEDAQRIFKVNRLVKLEADTLICQAKLTLFGLKKKSVDDINEYFEVRNKYIGPCRKLIRTEELRLNAKDYEKELNDLEERLKARIGKITKNYMVFMKANPMVSRQLFNDDRLEVVPFTMVKKKQMFRKAIESILCPMSESAPRECMPRPQKEVSAKFEILSERNLTTILQQGCSILVLKMNVMDDLGELVLQFENETAPAQEKVPIRGFLERVDFKRLNVLIISGQRAQQFADLITASYDECPLIVVVDHQKRNTFTPQNRDLYDIGYDEFAMRTLQRISANFFLCKLIELIVYSTGRIHSEDITRLINSSREAMVVYMMGFSKNTCSEERIAQFVRITIEQPKNKQLELEFGSGHFHDVSAQRSNLHNLSFGNTDAYVGREELLYGTIRQLMRSRENNEPAYINLFGVKGCGKSAFVEELGCMLLERSHYRSGIYLMNGWEIEQTYRGNINDYLERHKSEIFSITYLNEQKVDGSQMLLIIDDFHAIKNRSNYLDYFFNSIYSNRVNLVLTSNEELSGKSIPDFGARRLLTMCMRRLNNIQAMSLSFMATPLYDYDDFKEEYKDLFLELTRKNSQLQPRNIMEEFRHVFNKANKKAALEKYKNYREYIVQGYVKQLHLQLDKPHDLSHGPPVNRYHDEDSYSSRKRPKDPLSARPKHTRFQSSK